MDLCLECGLCCDGTLFSSMDVAPGEASSLPVVAEGGRLKVLQPCPAHDGSCKVYSERPRSCREFSCAPLEAVESGTMTLAEARAILARAKAQARSVRARLWGEGPLWRTVEGVIRSPEWRRTHADLLLDIALLRELLRRVHAVPTKGP